MTIAEALRESGLESVDAELLAGFELHHDRTWVLAHAHDSFDSPYLDSFFYLAERRKRGEPIAYILGEKEFFGRMFHVTPDTLIPRPATEGLVRITLDLLQGKNVESIQNIDSKIVAWSVVRANAQDVRLIVDIGTGSGCIGVSLACERPDLHIIATDISQKSLEIAQDNTMKHDVGDRITFRLGSGLIAGEPIDQPFLLVSNPPYIPDHVQLERDVADFEPHTALFAGKNGTDVLYPLINEALAHPLCRGFVVECREEQVIKTLHPNATSIAG